MKKTWFIFVALSIATLGSLGLTGVVMAADPANPGDFLYGVDRAVESIQIYLTYQPEKKASLELGFAQERLEELDALGNAATQSQTSEVIGDFNSSITHAVGLAKSVHGESADNVLAVFDQDSGLENNDDAEDSERKGNCQEGLEKEHPVAVQLAAQFDVDYQEIMNWFCDGWGFGEIRIAYEAVLENPEYTVEQLFEMRKSGLGWGEILATIGLKGKQVEDSTEDNYEEVDDELDESNRGLNCTGERENPHGKALALELGVPYEEVMNWFCQGFGFGEIKLAYSLSEQTGKPVEEIVAEKTEGKGWGVIMKELGGKNKPEKGKKEKDK
jgi:hypothetical protein